MWPPVRMVGAEATNQQEATDGKYRRVDRADQTDALGALGRGAVERVCEELGHAWRDRELDPATTVALFVQQVLHGNVACSEVRHLAARAAAPAARFTPSAYCQAR